jgi:hypothetical protein
MDVELERIRANVRQATTEDLLDRVTVYRPGMMPEALEIIEEELRERNVTEADVAAHREKRQDVLLAPEGWPRRCQRCVRPAVVEAQEWHRVWGLIPIFPHRVPYCAEHLPPGARTIPRANPQEGG